MSPLETAATTDAIGASYVRLALSIEQHLPGYIDAYFGPPEWKDEVAAAGKHSLDSLAAQAAELYSAAAAAPLTVARRRFLLKQLTAMQTTLRILLGARLPFAEEVEGLYDVSPRRVPEAALDEALRELDELLPGDGSVGERLRARRKIFEVPSGRALELFKTAQDEVRRRTRSLFDLPADEEVELRLVGDKPWGAYNWYLGRHRSLIEINTDSPVHVNALLGLMAHEGYPGHHTEHAIKERLLYERGGCIETCVVLINAPECVVSEGIATSAADVIFADGELEEWQQQALFPLVGVRDELTPGAVRHIRTLSRALDGVTGNAALMLHVEARSDEEVIAYLLRYSGRTPDEARRYLRFLRDPVFRSYAFTYIAGHALLDQLFARYDKVDVFRRVLSEPFTPSDLAAWAGGASDGAPAVE